MERIIKNIRRWMIIICCSCLCCGCNPQEEADATNTETENTTDADENALLVTDDNAGQNAREENHLAEISENTTGSDTLTETNSSDEPDVGENQLAQISDKVDEKAEPYIDAYVSLSDDTEIEYCKWMEYGEEQVLRVAIQYKEQPENDYQHKEDYFLFITRDGDVLNIIEVNYDDKGGPSGIETDCAAQHQLGWACGFDAHFEDVTFDGEEDLLISVGDSKSSRFYCAYIYENGKFRYERTFEHIPSYVIDTGKEVIYGSAVFSAGYFLEDVTYKYINGEFLLIETIETIYNRINGENVLDEIRKTTYEYEYINGKNTLNKTIETIDKYEYEFINGENVLNEIVETTYEYEYINGEKVLVEETVNIVAPEQIVK